jgi:hypothetical protein
MQQIPNNPKERQIRVDRAHADELQKIELATQDVAEIEINTRVLNKLRRKMQRRK